MSTKLIITLFLYFNGVIYAAEENEPETVLENSINATDAAKLLDEMQSADEALPFVLFKDDKNVFHMPKKLEKVVAQDGKMINGTEFITKNPSKQMFFCPHENADEECLVYQRFEGTQHLRCASEPKPIMQLEPNSEYRECKGVAGTGNSYVSVYKICQDDENQIHPDMIPFHRVCFDTRQQKTLFTLHVIRSPEMLHAKLLLREREVKYRTMTRDDFILSNKKTSDHVEMDKRSSSQLNPLKPAYKEQKLVPSEDMALALWRKTTFQYTNIKLQHQDLIGLWDEISEYIRLNAIQMYIRDHLKTSIFTGVFDIDTQEKYEDEQISNHWVKLVFTMKSSTPTHGISIIMNNFIDTKTGHSRENAIKGYCKKNLCTDTLTNKFAQIKGQVRCCSVGKPISDLFNLEDNIRLQELRIPNINVSEDQETLYDNTTNEKAATSIGLIEPNEILPIIFISNETDFSLHFPISIQQIETKNKRIVKGSKFLSKVIGKQLFFCPQKNSDDKCLVPQKFRRFQPLQCSKEAIPVASEVLTAPSKCGANNSGILYKVVYKICPKQEPYLYKTLEKEFYEFCYHPEEQRILYTRHKIISERLLFSNLLFLEHAVRYPMMTDVEVPLSNLPELKELTPLFTSEENKDSSLPTNTNESAYKLQQLVPSEDMAFALWKKTTYQYVNVALQHESLIPLWDKINEYIRNDAHYSFITIGSSMYNFVRNSIYTGVFDTQSTSKNHTNDQKSKKSKIWVKVIYSKTPSVKGIAILMNNFLIPETNDSHSDEDPLEQYCPENLCTKDLQNEFKQVGGRIRCCRLTYEIRNLFGISEINTEGRLMPILNITYQLKFKT